MKEIKREKYSSILKRNIPINDLKRYEDLNISLINKFLTETIEENIYNTIDLLELLRINYQGSLVETIKNIKDYQNVRFNCYYATKILKEKLNQVGITTYVITFKSIGYSSDFGDDLIKEAHMALIIPTLRDNKLYYLLLDPGLRIPCVLEFYPDCEQTVTEIDHDKIIIKKTHDNEYPYSMEIIGYNRYSTSNISYQCKEYFSLIETINPEEVLFPISYEVLDGYRIINFQVDKNKWALIKLMIIEGYLECCDKETNLKVSFQELKSMQDEEMANLVKPFAQKLNTNIEELINNISFILKHHQEFLTTIINSNVRKEKSTK